MSNLVTYAYFTVRVVERSGYMPEGYREFDVAGDEQVTFVLVMRMLERPCVLRGVLRRPDGTTQDRFQRDVRARSAGTYSEYRTNQVFGMKDLKAFPGEWTVDLFIDDDQAGAFAFFLGDAKAIARRRAETGR